MFPRTALVFYDSIQSEQVYRRGVRVYFNLEPSLLARRDSGAVYEPQRFQALAERGYVAGERAAKICSMAAGVESAEVAIQFAFRGPDARLIRNDQRSVHGR